MDVKQIGKSARGTTIVLRDFHTLEAMGGEWQGTVDSVTVMSGGGVLVYGLFVKPAPDVTLMVASFSGVKGMPDPAYRMYRQYVAGQPAARIDDPRFMVGGDFVPFEQHFDDMPREDPPLKYEIVGGFPMIFNGNPARKVCAWNADPSRTDPNYWARNCLVEVAINGQADVWFGWDLAASDVDLLVI